MNRYTNWKLPFLVLVTTLDILNTKPLRVTHIKLESLLSRNSFIFSVCSWQRIRGQAGRSIVTLGLNQFKQSANTGCDGLPQATRIPGKCQDLLHFLLLCGAESVCVCWGVGCLSVTFVAGRTREKNGCDQEPLPVLTFSKGTQESIPTAMDSA